jgi:hypothetical protein
VGVVARLVAAARVLVGDAGETLSFRRLPSKFAGTGVRQVACPKLRRGASRVRKRQAEA